MKKKRVKTARYYFDSEKLDEALKLANMWPAELARRTFISESFISALKSRRKLCGYKTAKRILSGFETEYQILDIFIEDSIE